MTGSRCTEVCFLSSYLSLMSALDGLQFIIDWLVFNAVLMFTIFFFYEIFWTFSTFSFIDSDQTLPVEYLRKETNIFWKQITRGPRTWTVTWLSMTLYWFLVSVWKAHIWLNVSQMLVVMLQFTLDLSYWSYLFDWWNILQLSKTVRNDISYMVHVILCQS